MTLIIGVCYLDLGQVYSETKRSSELQGPASASSVWVPIRIGGKPWSELANRVGGVCGPSPEGQHNPFGI